MFIAFIKIPFAIRRLRYRSLSQRAPRQMLPDRLAGSSIQTCAPKSRETPSRRLRLSTCAVRHPTSAQTVLQLLQYDTANAAGSIQPGCIRRQYDFLITSYRIYHRYIISNLCRFFPFSMIHFLTAHKCNKGVHLLFSESTDMMHIYNTGHYLEYRKIQSFITKPAILPYWIHRIA